MRIKWFVLLAALTPFLAFGAQPQPARSALIRSLISRPKGDVTPGYVLVKTKPSRAVQLQAVGRRTMATSRQVFRTFAAPTSYVSRIARTGWTAWRIPTNVDPKVAAAQIAKDPQVLYAQPMHRLYPLLPTPNDPDYAAMEDGEDFYLSLGEEEPPHFRRLWHLLDVNAFEAWSQYPNVWYTAATKPANAPLIAVIDTGCDMNHPDFINAGGAGSDTSQGGQLEKSLSKQFVLGQIVPDGTVEDVNGHGTHVTGLAVAAGNNGSFAGHGVIGSGYNCRAMVLRVIDDNGQGQDADAAAAIIYAADQGADVISISLGTTSYSQVFQDAVTYAWQKGSLVVAAGNESGSGGGPLGPIYPAQCSGALAVTANGQGGYPANDPTYGYAGTGDYIDISAPGGWINVGVDYYIIQFVYSTAMRTPGALYNNPNLYPPYELNYAYLAGTSMATPIVSGAAGLYYAAKGLDQQDGWSNDRAFRALEASAADVMGMPLGAWGADQGYGVLDMATLLQDGTTRNASVGAAKGIVYYGATPMANVAVKAQLLTGGTTFTTTTRADGTYRFGALPPGTYKVWTYPLGSMKTKKAVVKAGSDQNGLDFWCGGFTGDETAPVVPKFHIVGHTANSLTVQHWGYDTETGLDSIVFRVGRTAGGNDVMADTEVVPDGNTVTLTGLDLSPSGTYYLTGTYTNGGGIAASASDTLVVGPPVPIQIDLNPTEVVGGLRVSAKVTLSGPAPAGGQAVTLRYSSPLTVGPYSVTVAEGQTTASFTIKTAKTRRDETSIITARANGVSVTAPLLVKMTVIYYATLKSVSVSPTSVTGGTSVRVTVELEAPAPSGFMTVIALSDDSGYATTPANLMVPAGRTTASTTITTTAVPSDQLVTVTASYRGVVKTAQFTITR